MFFHYAKKIGVALRFCLKREGINPCRLNSEESEEPKRTDVHVSSLWFPGSWPKQG